MGKENLVQGNAKDLCDRSITCSGACVLPASGQNLQRVRVRANIKRTALVEKKATAPKRRAVLRDVTNVPCEDVYTNCFAPKSKANTSKLLKKTHCLKVVPLHEEGLKAKSSKRNVDAESVSLKIVPLTVAGPQVKGSEGAVESMEGDKLISLGRKILPNEPEVGDTYVKGKAAVSKGNFLLSSIAASDGPRCVDIDDDFKRVQLCNLYAPDIYQNLLAVELSRRPYPNYMETLQKDITQNMRGILIDWLVEVSEEYELVSDTLYLTVYLIDWFLYKNYIERQRLQLLGITCMLIASKYEEICAPSIEEFCFITDNTYTKQEVLKMEYEVLKSLSFHVYSPTTKTFLRRFLRAAHASYTSPSLELEYLAKYLAELTLMDYGLLKFRPSLIAASVVFLAKWTIDQSSQPWNLTLEHYTSYKSSDLKPSVRALQCLQLNASGCPLSAIRTKYRQAKFKSVAALTSLKLPDTLF